jgi:hypothetical protein
MPLHHLSSLYQCGAEHAQNKPAERLRVQQTLDQVCVMLYARAGLELKDPFSRILMEPIDPGAPVSDAASDAAQPTDAMPAADLPVEAQADAAAPEASAQPVPPEPEPEVIEPVTLGQSLPTQAKPVPA